MAHFHVYHDRADTPNCLLAIFDDEARAQRWINHFDPSIWVDKTMTKDCLKVMKK